MLEQGNGSGLTGFAKPYWGSSWDNQSSLPGRTSLIWGVQETHLLPPVLPHRDHGPAQRQVGGMKIFFWELRRVLGGTSAPRIASAANTSAPRGDVARLKRSLLSSLLPKQLLGVPACSLHPPPHQGEKAVRGEPGSVPGLSPTTAKLSPTHPACFARPQNIPAPPPCCCSFILFLDPLLLLALFYLFLVLIIPGFPQCFAFPPQPSSGCLFSLLVFLLSRGASLL